MLKIFSNTSVTLEQIPLKRSTVIEQIVHREFPFLNIMLSNEIYVKN